MSIRERFTQLQPVAVRVASFVRRRRRALVTVAAVLAVADPLLRRSMPGRPERRLHRH